MDPILLLSSNIISCHVKSGKNPSLLGLLQMCLKYKMCSMENVSPPPPSPPPSSDQTCRSKWTLFEREPTHGILLSLNKIPIDLRGTGKILEFRAMT